MRDESATETFQRDHTSPLRETNLMSDQEQTAIQEENNALLQNIHQLQSAHDNQTSELESVKT